MGTTADDTVMRRSDEYEDRDNQGYRDFHEPDGFSPRDNHEGFHYGEKPRYLDNMVRGTSHNFYINGDYFFPGKKVHCNRRQIKDLPHYLDHLTEKLGPRFGAVHRILTPRHGRPVQSLDDLQNDKNYVVAGMERFRHLQYDQITPSERKKSPPFKYDASPVYHARQLQCSGKINKIDTHSVLITVWPNGQYLRGPRRVLIPPRIVKSNNIALVVNEVNTFLKNDIVGTVEKLYLPSGIKVSDVTQISQNVEYIACKKWERLNMKGFRRRPNVVDAFSPRGDGSRKLPSLGNSTHNSSPENSNASTGHSPGNGYGRRRRPLDRREPEDQVFPARPVKHTRNTQQVDLDRDDGVFRAKEANRNTRGAREVQDSRSTKTELPVDLREAREVEDETTHDTRDDSRNNNNNNRYNNGRAPPPRGGGMMAKPNSKRPPPAPAPTRDPARDRELEFKRNQSATKIQSHYRGYQARKQYNRPQQRPAQKENRRRDDDDNDDMSEDRAASQIQANYRGYKTRKNLREKDEAATAIQSGVRGRNSRNAKRDRAEKDEAAKDIQSAYRGHQSRNASRKSDRKEEEEAATKIQSAYRGHRSRSQQRKPRETQPRKQSMDDDVDKAATKIQSNYRGYRARKDYRERQAAAQDIQSAYRGHQSRRSTSRSPRKQPTEDDFSKEDQAATKLQANYRGYRTRKNLREQNEAAETIQSGYRGHQSRSRSRPSARDEEDDFLKKENAAATKIQANYRGHRARKQYPKRGRASPQEVTKEDSYDDLDKETQAATKIQSNYRGYRTRKEYQRTRAAAN